MTQRFSCLFRAQLAESTTTDSWAYLRVLLKTVFPEDAEPAAEPPAPVSSFADPKDQPILAAAVAQQCRYLVTLNEKDLWPPPEMILVVRPGELVRMLRSQLAGL